jgi:hypothetical protein
MRIAVVHGAPCSKGESQSGGKKKKKKLSISKNFPHTHTQARKRPSARASLPPSARVPRPPVPVPRPPAPVPNPPVPVASPSRRRGDLVPTRAARPLPRAHGPRRSRPSSSAALKRSAATGRRYQTCSVDRAKRARCRLRAIHWGGG